MLGGKKDNKKGANFGQTTGSANRFGSETIIQGEIKSNGDIRVDGKIIGTVVTKSKLVVGGTGSVEGDIHCKNATIEGVVVGRIEVDELLDLKKNANIQGDIITKKMVVEEGAVFNGTCSMGAKARMNGESKAPREDLKSSITREAV